jgi:hypothetical protein
MTTAVSCETTQELLPLLLMEELDSVRQQTLEGHVQTCGRCAELVRTHKALWSQLERWPMEPVSAELDRAVRVATVERPQLWRQPVVQVALALGFGTLACVGGTFLLSGASSLRLFHPATLLFWGAVWAGLSAFAFLLFVRGDEIEPAHEFGLRLIGLGGLVTLGLSLGLTKTCSVRDLVSYCEMQPWTRALFGNLGTETSYFVFGGLYALLPLLLVSFFLGDRLRRRPVVAGLLMGALFLALSLPGIVLQCGAFSFGVALSWIVGAALGSLVAGPAGAWLRARVFSPADAERLA